MDMQRDLDAIRKAKSENHVRHMRFINEGIPTCEFRHNEPARGRRAGRYRFAEVRQLGSEFYVLKTQVTGGSLAMFGQVVDVYPSLERAVLAARVACGLPPDAALGSSVLGTWNMAPSQCNYVYRNEPSGARGFVSLYWGLLPFWAKEPKGVQPINAMCETVAEKPMFRKLIRDRRCLVAADGFYEWMKTPSGKVPHYITHAGGEPIFFAGLWDCWHEGQADARPTFTIMTTEPNELVSKVHGRMPVIVRPEHYALWMDAAVRDPGALSAVYEPFPAEQMRAYPVSTRVNKPQNNDAALLEPVDA